jgi:5-methylcytosine-specific restriction protein A
MPTTPKTFQPRRPKIDRRGTKQQRGYGGEWERISKMVRAQHPVCQICNAAPSVHTDHIQPFNGINDPLRTDHSNLQALCLDCHHTKTRNDHYQRAMMGG